MAPSNNSLQANGVRVAERGFSGASALEPRVRADPTRLRPLGPSGTVCPPAPRGCRSTRAPLDVERISAVSLETWELLSYVVTVIGLPLAIAVFLFEQRKERENEEEGVKMPVTRRA